MKKIKVFICISFLLFSSRLVQGSFILPQDLMDFMSEKKLVPIETFFNRPGLINPPYIYGMEGVTFWSKKGDKFILTYLKYNFKARKWTSEEIFSTRNFPGGLQINECQKVNLSSFTVINSKENYKTKKRIKKDLLISEYDGVRYVFIKHEKEWLMRRYH